MIVFNYNKTILLVSKILYMCPKMEFDSVIRLIMLRFLFFNKKA